MKKCQFCAEEIQDEAIVCKHCGRDLVPPVPPPKKKRRVLRGVLIIVGGLFVLAMIGTLMEMASPSGERSSGAIALLENADEDHRANILRNAIQSSGESCSEVTRTFFQGTVKSNGSVFWNASCLAGKSYAVQVMNDAGASTKVLDCDVLRTVTRVACFQRLN